MRDTIELAREAGGRAQQNKNCDVEYLMSADALKAFEALAAPVQEPVAFFDPQEKGFYWAKPMKIIAPVTVDVKPLPLYITPPAQPAPVQGPWKYRRWDDAKEQWELTDDSGWPSEPVYTTPPAAQRTWVGLTPEKIDELMYRFTGYELLYAIQAELKENNT
jgi:hypothetical protein